MKNFLSRIVEYWEGSVRNFCKAKLIRRPKLTQQFEGCQSWKCRNSKIQNIPRTKKRKENCQSKHIKLIRYILSGKADWSLLCWYFSGVVLCNQDLRCKLKEELSDIEWYTWSINMTKWQIIFMNSKVTWVKMYHKVKYMDSIHRLKAEKIAFIKVGKVAIENVSFLFSDQDERKRF